MYDCYKLHHDIDKKINAAGIACNFHIEKQTSIKDPEFVAITCLFKMSQSYRNFSIYLNQLSATCRANINNPIIIRIYYDGSVEADVKRFSSYKNVELVRYEFPDVLDKHGGHQGTFGTLMRTLPIFNFTNNSVICHGFDADMLLDYKEVKRCIIIMRRYDAPYYGLFYDNLNLNGDIDRVGTNVFGDLIIATYLAEPNKLCLHHLILTDFIKAALDRSPLILAWIDNNNNNRNNAKLNTVFKYGIDEYFANSYLLPAIHAQHNVIGTRLYMNVRKVHYELYKAIKHGKINKSEWPALISKLSIIFEGIVKPNANLLKYISAIDIALEKTLGIFRSLNNNIQVYKNYLDLLIDLKKNKTMQFNTEQTEYLEFNSKTEFVDSIYILHKQVNKHQLPPMIEQGGNNESVNTLIILPYGNLHPAEHRNKQLIQILDHFKKLNNKIPILVAEQIDPTNKFNKGQLYNIAVNWYVNQSSIKPTRLILHDIDLLPDKILYSKYVDPNLDMPIQLVPTNAEFIKKYGSSQPVPVGGAITAISLADYLRINGFPNNCAGWGGEDNMFQNRLKTNKIYYHYNDKGNFTSTDIQRKDDKSKQEYIDKMNLRSSDGWKKIKVDKSNWANNGISQLPELHYDVQEQTDGDNASHIHIKVKLDSMVDGGRLHRGGEASFEMGSIDTYGAAHILIVVPFADFKPEEKRAKQLKQFLAHMANLIKPTRSANICIVVAEQVAPLVYFNRGQLLNAGVKWYTEQHGEPNFIILHDVDMLPDKILYSEYLKINGHISLVPQDQEYKQKYGRVILSAGGGIYGLPYADFKATNGYPNGFWTWGAEDDAFGKRLVQINKTKFARVRNGHIAHIDTQRQSHQSKMEYLRRNKIRSMMVYENLAEDKQNWKSDGYNSVQAEVASTNQIGKLCAYHVKFNLDEKKLVETIAHNDQVYKELGGAKAL